MKLLNVGLVVLSALVCVTAYGGGELFKSDAERAGFMRALESKDRSYDPAEKMLAGRFSGYPVSG